MQKVTINFEFILSLLNLTKFRYLFNNKNYKIFNQRY